jgi:hypothetical protein
MKKISLLITVVMVTSLHFASAQNPAIPTLLADKSSAAKLPTPIEPDMKGYGTRGVQGRTLAAMLDSCRRPNSPLSKVEAARCDQLERALKAQPDATMGNSNDVKQ